MTGRTAFALLLSVFFVLPALRPASAQEVVGTVDSAQGATDAVRADVPTPLAAGSDVLLDDTLRTGEGARLAATLADKTAIQLGENAEMTIDSFVYAGKDKGKGGAVLEAVQGAFLVVGGAVEKRKAGLKVKTPVATISLRGTTVWGGRIDDAYGVFVAEGLVTVTTQRGRVTLRPGEGTSISDDLRPEKPRRWPQEKVDRALRSVRP
ncbi:FecR family protein [Nostoc sp. NIES-2111]